MRQIGMCKTQEPEANTWSNVQSVHKQQHPRFCHSRCRDSPTQMCVGTDLQHICWCLPEPCAAPGICQVLAFATARLWVPQAKGISRMLARRAKQLEIRAEAECTEWIILANIFLSRNIPLKTRLSLPLLLEKS